MMLTISLLKTVLQHLGAPHGLNAFQNQYGDIFLYYGGDVYPVDSLEYAVIVIRTFKENANYARAA